MKNHEIHFKALILCTCSGTELFTSGPGCSKLATSLVNVSLKFQMLISEISHFFC